MKRRIRNKIEKRKNLNRQEAVLNSISKQFTVEKKMFGTGSFFYYLGLNGVCHFTLKETPGWRYAIWLSDNGFEIFGDHEDLVQKFQPEHTYMWFFDVQTFIDKVKAISEYPEMYFVDSLTRGDVFVDFKEHKHGEDIWYKGYQVVRESIRGGNVSRDLSMTQEAFVQKKYTEFQEWKEEREQKQELDRVYAFEFFKEIPYLFEEIIAVGVVDGNKGGGRCSPRYTLAIVTENISQKRCDELFEQVDKIVREKNKAKQTPEHQFDLYASFDRLEDIKKYDYKYFKKKQIA